MRTEEQKQAQIKGLQKMRSNLPEYSLFGDPNWEGIDVQISMLSGLTKYEDYKDDEPEIEEKAYECQNWLDGDTDEDFLEE